MYGIMTKISSVSSQNQLLMLKNAPEFTKIMIGEICTSLELNVEIFFFVHTSSCNFTDEFCKKLFHPMRRQSRAGGSFELLC